MDDNNDEAVSEQANMLYWKAKMLKEEFSKGEPVEPVPEPPPPIQYPTVTKTGWLDVMVSVRQIFGLCVGVLLIGVSIGMYLNEFEWRND